MSESVRRIVLHGDVQGIGLRPALARLAASRGWSGSVRNTTRGVEMLVRGKLPADVELRKVLIELLPHPIRMDYVAIEHTQEVVQSGFQILESTTGGMVASQIPRDRAICQACLGEVQSSRNRRYQYPFITCAACGPRYSLLTGMPFDRARTTMGIFSMCDECRREYADPCDRRFHAQTISCPQCGPRIWMTRGGKEDNESPRTLWESAADALRSGEVVALRGVGGYQLLVDAASSKAVSRLRMCKQREAKPLAVLCRNLSEAHRLAHISPIEAEQLASTANPIVLLRQRIPSDLAADLNPGVSDIGLMLPTTAMHDLLLSAFGGPLVCTSGNVEGEPMAYQIDDALQRLGGIADLFIHHNREIQNPIDDSVVRVIAGRCVTLRAARGIAPMQLKVPQLTTSCKTNIMAVGGHQKSAISLFNGGLSVLGPHVGDLDSLLSQQRWDEQTHCLSRLIHGSNMPSEATCVCDCHPRYFPSEWSQRHSHQPRRVWHHHAHVVTGMIEHEWLDRDVLGIAWDGTGLGPDGTIWGGEFLLTTATSFERVAHLRPFRLPGGESCIADIRRTALSVLTQLGDVTPQEIVTLLGLSGTEVSRLTAALKSSFSPVTTSCGRLFDAAACLILGQTTSGYEGHAALGLESACDNSESGAYEFPINETSPLQVDWRPAFRSMILDRRAHEMPGRMATKFHRGLAEAVVAVANRFAQLPVVLSGGVFQNRVLVESIVAQWHNDRQPLALPGRLPPNDGGLAAGQLAAAMLSSSLHKEPQHVSGNPRPTICVDRSRSPVGQGQG